MGNRWFVARCILAFCLSGLASFAYVAVLKRRRARAWNEIPPNVWEQLKAALADPLAGDRPALDAVQVLADVEAFFSREV